MARGDLSDQEWERLAPLLPPERDRRGRPSLPHRQIVNGILWTVSHRAPWISVIATAPSVPELLAAGGGLADVVLLDLDLGHQGRDEESDPTANVRALRTAGPQVLIFTATDNRPVPIRQAIKAGAIGGPACSRFVQA